ncbi:MAG: DUF1841 family protein [Candidatus Sedimenticola sp. (ex Thyasira tokunagai)]
MFGNDRVQMRRFFTEAWQKAQGKQPLEPLEQVIVNIIELHPEYHSMLNKGEDQIDRDFLPEGGKENPFLHMGMHISLQEQISTDRPSGIGTLYQQLVSRCGDPHDAEHKMMECLGRMLWEAQRANRMPDEQAYLQCLRNLTG